MFLLVKILLIFLDQLFIHLSSDLVKHFALQPPINIKALLFIGTIRIDGTSGQKLKNSSFPG